MSYLLFYQRPALQSCLRFDLKEASIISASRKGKISEARGIICYLAVNDLGYSASEVAHALDLRRVSAGQCVTRGEKLLLCREI